MGEMLQRTHGRDAATYPWERCPWERCCKTPMGRGIAPMSDCLHVFYMVIISVLKVCIFDVPSLPCLPSLPTVLNFSASVLI